MTMMS